VHLPGGGRLGLQGSLFAPVPRYEVIPGLVEAQGRLIGNVNAGIEAPVGRRAVLRGGLFTNLAASPATRAESQTTFDDPTRLPHVNYYGATAGLSLVSGESSVDLSAVYQYGAGFVPSQTSPGYDDVRASILVLMLGGTYAFGDGVSR
jgi:hypothetical protein